MLKITRGSRGLWSGLRALDEGQVIGTHEEAGLGDEPIETSPVTEAPWPRTRVLAFESLRSMESIRGVPKFSSCRPDIK